LFFKLKGGGIKGNNNRNMIAVHTPGVEITYFN